MHLAKEYESMIGLPQGCSLSPILFCLFVSDLPEFLTHSGVLFGGIMLKYLMFADDLALLAETAEELQIAIDSLTDYCVANGLKINAEKTKVLIFHRGRLPTSHFTFNDQPLEIVNEFTYLGFTFTSQLSFTKHLEILNSKAASKCGFLLSKLKPCNIPINIVLDLFNCYVLPTYRYGLALWLGKCFANSVAAMNSVFTKYLKMYLRLPFHANNSICHYITETQPLNETLQSLLPASFSSLKFPEILNGIKLTMNDNKYPTSLYDPIPSVPTFFWRSKTYFKIPTYAHSRKALCHEIFDITHRDICTNENFHPYATLDCRCALCGGVASYYPQYFCEKI